MDTCHARRLFATSQVHSRSRTLFTTALSHSTTTPRTSPDTKPRRQSIRLRQRRVDPPSVSTGRISHPPLSSCHSTLNALPLYRFSDLPLNQKNIPPSRAGGIPRRRSHPPPRLHQKQRVRFQAWGNARQPRRGPSRNPSIASKAPIKLRTGLQGGFQSPSTRQSRNVCPRPGEFFAAPSPCPHFHTAHAPTPTIRANGLSARKRPHEKQPLYRFTALPVY